MLWLTKFFTKGKSLKDGIKYFHTINGRMPNNIEIIKIKNAFMDQTRKSNVIDITSRIKDEWWKRPGFKRQHPEVTKKGSDDLIRSFEETTGEKVDTDTYSALLERQSKELENIDMHKGTSFYREMGDIMKKHRREELEFQYDEMFNKILEKAKRIERDPKVLLEAELGTKLTGEETTTQLLDLFKNRPKKASGGIARVGYFAGEFVKPRNWKLFREFVEKLFIKASNDIRLGKGKWKGLDQKQRIVQHDNLTKMVEKWQKTKKLPEGAEQYFGVDAEKAFAGATKKVKKDRVATADELDDYIEILDPTGETGVVEEGMTIGKLDDMVADHNAYMADMKSQYMRGDLDKYVKPEVLEEQALRRQKKIDDVLAKAYDEVFYQKPVTGDYKLDADVLSDSIAEQLGKGSFTDLPQTHQTQIYNTALKRVTQDMKMKKSLKDVEQKIELQMFDTKDKTPHASGGVAGQLHLNRPGYKSGLLAKLFKLKKKPTPKKTYLEELAEKRKKIMGDEAQKEKDFEMRLQEILAKHSTKHAEGGRVSYTKGGLAHVLGV